MWNEADGNESMNLGADTRDKVKVKGVIIPPLERRRGARLPFTGLEVIHCGIKNGAPKSWRVFLKDITVEHIGSPVLEIEPTGSGRNVPEAEKNDVVDILKSKRQIYVRNPMCRHSRKGNVMNAAASVSNL